MRPFIASFVLLAVMVTASYAQHGHPAETNKKMDAGKKEVLHTLENFRMAIINNDQEQASRLLTDDARILESGGVESKQQYLSHHFHADGKFLNAMQRELKSQKVQSTEHTAWVSTISHIHGTNNDRDISISSAELAVLVKTDADWKIASLHWSSRNAK